MEDIDAPSAQPPGDQTELLLRFLNERNHPCPKCDYDLCNLTRPVCPECGEELALSVGRRNTNYELLILTLAPGIFSGITAGLLLIPFTYFGLILSRGVLLPMLFADFFGLFSGFSMLMLFRRRRAFMKLPRRRQLHCVAGVWLIHIAAFVALLISMPW